MAGPPTIDLVPYKARIITRFQDESKAIEPSCFLICMKNVWCQEPSNIDLKRLLLALKLAVTSNS
jgi:hypothetical protein